VGDTRYLRQRRQTWYSRVKVPAHLRDAYGKPEIVRSLQTRDLGIAQSRRWAHVQEAMADFERFQAYPGAPSPEEIQEQAWETYHDALEQAEADGLDEEALDQSLDVLRDALIEGKLGDLEEAKALAVVAAFNGRIAALRGRPYQPPASFGRTGVDRVTLKPITPRARITKRSEGALAFSEAARSYLEELQRDPDASVTQQTVGQYEAVHRLFTDFSKDAVLEDVTRAMASEFLATVATLAPSWGRRPGTKGLTLAELLERYGGQRDGLSNRTLNRYAAACGAVYKWAKRRGHYEGDNPFEGQARKKASGRKTGWVPFTDDELATLLGAMRPEVAPNKHTIETWLPWATWIAAYSGLRLNEICSLDAEDLRQEDGVWFFDVKGAKTEAGDRRVPVHSTLIKLGLLEYRDRIGAGSLWPALKPGGPDQKMSWYASKRFTVARRGLGLVRPRLSFHSLRKNVATALERASVPESEAVQVLGHEKMSMSYSVYSLGLDLNGLKRVVEVITYPEV
jgi:integrase